MKSRHTPLLLVLLASAAVALCAHASAETARTLARQPPSMADALPRKMQSFALYGDQPIPNARAGPNEEFGADRGFLQKVSRPQILVYLPAKTKANGAGILIFPGGSYAGLTFELEGIQPAQFLVDHGIAAFVVKYRTPSDRTMVNKSLGPLEDAQQAIRFVRLHSKAWNLDPARVGAIGFSAGGHVASTLATHFNRAYIA